MLGHPPHQQCLAAQYAVAEAEPDAAQLGEPDFDHQFVVVTRGGLVFHMALDDGEDYPGFLQLQQRHTGGTEQLAASRLQEIKVTRVVDVVADGALGVGHTMAMAENLSLHGSSVNAVPPFANREHNAVAPQPEEFYRPFMDWQQATALTIVTLTAGAFLWRGLRPRKATFQSQTGCGCTPASDAKGSIVISGRKGERATVHVKMP